MGASGWLVCSRYGGQEVDIVVSLAMRWSRNE
jgi:hypothetical protein